VKGKEYLKIWRKDMINNYLDYVKRMRKFAITRLREDRNAFRDATDPWCQGFYKGLFIATSFEACRWRRLQKDIEATLAFVAKEWPRESTDPLVAKFDI